MTDNTENGHSNEQYELRAVVAFLASPGPSLTHRESDIIKLTAQFIATYGRNFLVELVAREQNNPDFDFLKPQHGQFKYMTNLVMQYCLIRNYPLDILEQLRLDSTSQKHIMERMESRADYERMIENEKKKQQEKEERERLLYSQIDWQDFVVVETVNYQPGEEGDFPPPTTADQVGTRFLQQQRLEELTVPQEMDIDMEASGGELNSPIKV